MNLPDTVWIVKRIPPKGEKQKYYSVSKKRIYYQWSHVRQFLDANKDSEFDIYEADVKWEKV